MKRLLVALVLGASGAALVGRPVSAQNGELQELRERLAKETYVTPPAEVARLVTAPRHLNVTLSEPGPDRRRFLKVVGVGLPPVTVFGRRWHNLAGLQIDPRANRARTLTTRAAAGLEIVDALSGRATRVEVPQGATVSNAQWSPDGSQVAFIANFDDASYVYVADAANGRSRRVTPTPVLATLVTSVAWTGDGRSIVTVLPPEGRGAEPSAPPVATGPQVRLTTPGAKNKTRTYADLLEGPYDQALLEYYATGQLAVVDVAGRGVRRIGRPAMIQAVDPSPDGRYLRVTLLQKPFSYFVPVSAFGTVDELWDANGTKVVEVARRPLRESDSDQPATNTPGPNAANDTARRSIGWMPNGQGLYYLQQEPAPRPGAPPPRGAHAPHAGGRARAPARPAVPVGAAVRLGESQDPRREQQPDRRGAVRRGRPFGVRRRERERAGARVRGVLRRAGEAVYADAGARAERVARARPRRVRGRRGSGRHRRRLGDVLPEPGDGDVEARAHGGRGSSALLGRPIRVPARDPVLPDVRRQRAAAVRRPCRDQDGAEAARLRVGARRLRGGRGGAGRRLHAGGRDARERDDGAGLVSARHEERATREADEQP